VIDLADAGVSDAEGKDVALEWIRELAPRTVLDVGAGRGEWRSRLFPSLDASWTAVEAWRPYVEAFDLEARYDRVVVADVRSLAWHELGRFDLVIFGDVLEHMCQPDALVCWQKARWSANWLLLSVPIIEWPQDSIASNPYERHRSTWSDSDARSMPGLVRAWTGTKIGVYLAKGFEA
jgi:predicted TPR repeat methyltransferase